MTELFVTSGPQRGTRVSLKETETYTIGDATDASLRIQGIEPKHLIVKALKGGGFGVKSLGAAFDLNGVPTAVARLKDGDTIRVGDASIRYGKPEASAANQSSAVKPAASAAKPAAAKPKANKPEKASKMIGGFRLIGGLGKGGMGTVYRAEQVSLHREIALKVLSKNLTNDPVFVAGFVAEARAAARLHHPNVVQVFDVDNDGDTYFYSMELMHAGSIETRLKKEGRIPFEDAIGLIVDAAKGLAFAESMHIVHRDIKPDNLMVDQHGHVKIADLGLAQHSDAETGKIVGTPHFMSPEQVQNKKLDHRSDLYALGCTFYRILTGRTPFQKDSKKAILIAQVKEQALPVHKVDPEIPVEVSNVIERMMAKELDERYQSANELIEDLEALFVPESKKGLVIGAIAVAVIVTISAIIWAATREGGTKVVEKRVEIENPNAAKERQRTTEAEAKAAFLEVRIKSLQGIALADALDAMAAQHKGTEAAREAAELARETRAIEKARADAATRRRFALEQAITGLRTAFDTAVKSSDFRAAAATLDTSSVAENLRTDPKVIELIATLKNELSTAARARLVTLKAPIEKATESRDAAALRAAIRPLEQILNVDKGWPAIAFDETQRAILAKFLEHAQVTAKSIQSDKLLAIETTAWSELQSELRKQDGVFGQLYNFQFAKAAATADALSARFEGRKAKTPIERLAPAFRKADQFYQAYLKGIAAGTVTIPVDDGKPLVVLSLVVDGSSPGLEVKQTVRTRAKKTFIPLADVRSRMTELFVLPAGQQDKLARDTFLAVLGISTIQHDAQAFLAVLNPKDDNSGMGPQAFQDHASVISLQLPDLQHVLEQHDWTQALSQELSAARHLASGLRAISRGRNQAASSLIERVIRDHGNQLTIRALR